MGDKMISIQNTFLYIVQNCIKYYIQIILQKCRIICSFCNFNNIQEKMNESRKKKFEK